MDIVLKGATVIDPSSPFHLSKSDIRIQNGLIAEIGEIAGTDEVVNIDGLSVSPGFCDVFTHACDPGHEYRETLETAAKSAAFGGYTNVFLLPNTAPCVDGKGTVEYIVQRSAGLPVSFHPIGAITKEIKGKELAEMYDMANSGAVAFTDGLSPVASAGLLVKALQYLQSIGKVIIQVPDDPNFSGHGLMNEGIVSTRLGLPGKPAVAEELVISRDIELAKYTGGKLHFTGISKAKGIELIRKAKDAGVQVTCSVTPYHLLFIDEDLASYDTNLKLTPPLRTSADRDALRNAVQDGTVDCIASHHLPQHIDNKIVEFEYAKDGMIGLETCYSVIRTAMPVLSPDRIIELLSINPRKIFDLPLPSIQVGHTASMCLYLPNTEWTPQAFHSKSRNTPFLGKTLTGKPLGVIHKDRLFLRP